MAIKKFKPTSPALRQMTVLKSDEITCNQPEKSLLVNLKKNAGRNVHGKITVRHKGGGNKRKYRLIDFKRNKDGVPAKVATIEYDPNRTANIAILSGLGADIKPGNCLELKDMPVGTLVHNIELKAGKGGQLVRTAGASAQLMAKEGTKALLRLPSGEMRYVNNNCRATVGQVGNIEYGNVVIGKAGRKRHMGIRPTVRGSVMNPNDHPHGGGEGRAPIGRPSPVTPWGKPALGYKTRKKNKASNKLIVSRRTK